MNDTTGWLSDLPWYGVDGRRIDALEAGALLLDWAKRHVAYSVIPQPDGTRLEVSTVFIVLDHRLSGQGPPVLWETMTFGSSGKGNLSRRYTSRADAEQGHAELVAMLTPGKAGMAGYRHVVTARRRRAQRVARRARRARQRERMRAGGRHAHTYRPRFVAAVKY
jgi:hypothetical protein